MHNELEIDSKDFQEQPKDHQKDPQVIHEDLNDYQKDNTNTESEIDSEDELMPKEFNTNFILKKKTVWTERILQDLLFRSTTEPTTKSNGHKDQIFVCENCDKKFDGSTRLKRHKMMHTDERKYLRKQLYSCQKCQKFFKRESLLKRHDLLHTGEKPFACQFCGFKSRLKHNMKLHEKSHQNEKPFSCMKCFKRFKYANHLRIHDQIHSSSKNKQYFCKYCTKKFENISGVIIHERVHTGKSLSEALILASTNPQYDKRLFIDLPGL